jgi:RND family efflux transporter MFP subunit
LADLKDQLASLRIDRKSAAARRVWPVLLIVLCLAAGGGYLAWQKLAKPAPFQVETGRAQATQPGGEAEEVPVLTASGYLVARKKAVVSAKIQGRLSELRVEEGSRVALGEVIARLESADQEAQVERARAALQRGEAELEEHRRQLRLAESQEKEGIVSKDELEAARSRTRVSEAALRQAQADLGVYEAWLENTVIRAPFAGVVIKKMAEVGESVAPIPPGVNVSTSSGAIVALADMSTLEMEADVNESHIAKLRPEHPAVVRVEAIPDRRFRAVLRQIIPSADRTKATVLVKVTILEKDELLKPEMSARVTFLNRVEAPAGGASAQATLITAPAPALTERDGLKVVFEAAQGKASRRVVAVGEAVGDRVVIQSGLGGSEVLILNPPPELQDGAAIEIK